MELAEALSNVNVKAFPGRYDILKEILNNKFGGVLPKLSTFKDRVKFHIRYIAILDIFALLGTVFIALLSIPRGYLLPILILQVVVFLVSIIGLLMAQEWARILTLIFIYYKFADLFFSAYTTERSSIAFLIVFVLSALFYVYQIAILHRAETKAYFSEGGEV